MSRTKGISFDELQEISGASERDVLWAAMRKDFATLDYFIPLKGLKALKLKKMFGGLAVSVGPKLCLAIMESPQDYRYKDKISDFPIWDGVLICTSRHHHKALQTQMKHLIEHPILPKWLYLRRSDPQFERVCKKLCALLMQRSPLIGVVKKRPKAPQPHSKRIPNLGKLTRAEIEKCGIKTYGDFLKLGWKKVWLRVARKFPSRTNLNMGRALYGAELNKSWRNLTQRELKKLRNFQQLNFKRT